MTTVYSKNGICFLIPPASNYRCNGEVWCYCNNSEIISDLFPNLALACVTIRRPILFSDCGKRQVFIPHRDSIIYRVFWK
ncbi:Uncharacterised protein [Escherichia coli]|nr:Uncharacterised protein [Escherichia coli]